jgi:cytochrome c2
MTCAPGKPCEEGRKRRDARGILALMAIIFILLSVASFVKSRNQAIPGAVSYGPHGAVDGKRVFQAYNCMGCHTILGNGAYLGPDLTNIYQTAGPAWLEAFLPSAGGWPTGPAVQVHLQRPELAEAIGASSLDDYLKRYPGAAERVHRRGGTISHMPNLQFRPNEVGQLIAFLKYTSEMNTEGWPPRPRVDGLTFSLATPMPGIADAAATPVAAGSSASATTDPAAQGEQLVKASGCTACHASDTTKLVGPGWGGLYGSQVTLADGTSVQADDAYLAASIRTPDAQVASGYAPGTMPSYASLLDDGQIETIVAYLRTLSGEGQ